VGHLLVKKPVTIPGEATILEAAKLMVSRNIGVLVLVNPKKPDTPLGIVSERDIVRGLVDGVSVEEHVFKVATKRLVTVQLGDDVAKATSLMTHHRIRHLLVLKDNGSLAGVISIRDLLLAEHLTLKTIISSYHGHNGAKRGSGTNPSVEQGHAQSN
jgi:CBS domain-containing protein